MPLLTSLLILIVAARLLGHLALRFGLPEMVGEMMAGVLLGPALINAIHPNLALSAISELAVFLIVLSAGLEMNFKEVASAFRGKGLVIGLLGFLVPMVAGVALGVAFGFDVMRSVFLGLAVSITALPVAVKILDGFKLLRSDLAVYAIGAAVFSDVAALLALGVILGLSEERSFMAVFLSILTTGGKLVLLASFILGVNWAIHRMIKGGIHIERIPEKMVAVLGGEALFGIVVLFVLVFGAVSDALGFHSVIGAFFGALLIDKKFFFASRYSELERTIGSVTNGFLAPVFFAYLGLEIDVASLHSMQFILALITISVLSKIAAGWIGGRFAGRSPAESLGLGVILNGRGVMGLVIASIAFERGFIGKGLFSSLVLMSIFTTVLAPLLFRRFVYPKLSE